MLLPLRVASCMHVHADARMSVMPPRPVAHPPLWVVDWEAEVVDHSVVMAILVRVDLCAHRKTLQAQVKVGAHCALDPRDVRDVLVTVVAMIERPALALCEERRRSSGLEGPVPQLTFWSRRWRCS